MIDFFQGPEGKALKQVVYSLWNAGYEAYLAGGCVRDFLLKRPFKDIDIATSAKPDDLVKLFPNHIPVGKQFGIIIVVVGPYKFEVATFRSDGEYLDGRHPENIVFTNAEEDAKRRDFTINALFYDLQKNKIIDFVDGGKDLDAKLIKAVGNPHQRFKEDYLRILRALRFQIQLKFEIEAQTWMALCQEVKNLNAISGERISEELYKGLAVDPKAMLNTLKQSGAWNILFPYFGPAQDSSLNWETVGNKILSAKGDSTISKGEALTFLLLQSELVQSCEAFKLESPEKIIWSLQYEEILKKVNSQLKLSRDDFKALKNLGATRSWNNNWSQLRPAFRYELLSKPENKSLADFMTALDQTKLELQKDKDFAKNPPQAFLTGKDVEKLDPKQRGSVLKESFYLQWEQVLTSREEALNWLVETAIKS